MTAINELPMPIDHPQLIVATTAKTWHTCKGRELVTLHKGSNQAKVHPATCDALELRALAQACHEAADEMEGNVVKVRVSE